MSENVKLNPGQVWRSIRAGSLKEVTPKVEPKSKWEGLGGGNSMYKGPGTAPRGAQDSGGCEDRVSVGSGDRVSLATTLVRPQLERPANLNAQVAVAQLPEQGELLPQGTQCLAMGWGQLDTREPTAHVLQELNVTVMTILCRAHNVCTFVPRRKAGICFVCMRRAPRALRCGRGGCCLSGQGARHRPLGRRGGRWAAVGAPPPHRAPWAVPRPLTGRGTPSERVRRARPEAQRGTHAVPAGLRGAGDSPPRVPADPGEVGGPGPARAWGRRHTAGGRKRPVSPRVASSPSVIRGSERKFWAGNVLLLSGARLPAAASQVAECPVPGLPRETPAAL